MGLISGTMSFREAIFIRAAHLAGPSPHDCPDYYILRLDNKDGGSTGPYTDGIDVMGLRQLPHHAVLFCQRPRAAFDGMYQMLEGVVDGLPRGIQKGYGPEGGLKLTEHLWKTLDAELIDLHSGLVQDREPVVWLQVAFRLVTFSTSDD
jgi:hypothetical protein